MTSFSRRIQTEYGRLDVSLDRENLGKGGSHPVTVTMDCNFLACNLADVNALIKGFEDIRTEMTR